MLIRSEPARVREAIAWWLQATGGYGVKLVNPGGVEMWKRDNANVTSLDDEGPGVTPRQVIETIATAVHDLGLPHPVHVHCNNLGVSGNCRTTLDTLRTLEGRRAHLAHLQFHAYGGRPGGRPRSRGPELAEYLNGHPELSADVGQVMFGPATTMTADAPVSAVLREITHGRWVNADTEVETGCGIVPFAYREKNYVHALQWGIGLELFLLSRDPWRLVLSTDHPNGGSFLSYPRLIRLLMDREFRNEQIGRVNKQAMKRTVLLDDLDREYTLEEIAIITRAGPARLLGLRDKGHLGVGADADITIYDDREDREEMFAAPRYVIKDGHAVVEDGELREAGPGRLLRVGAEYDPSIEPTLEALFEDRYSVRFSSYPVREPWLLEPARTVAAQPRGRDEAARRRDRGHLRRGVRNVGRARGHHRRDPGVGAGGGPLDDRLCHLGDRLQVRGEHRARARRRRDPRRAARGQRPAVRDGPGGRRQAARRARRADGADVSDDGVLQRPRRGGHGRRRGPAALLRRRLSGQQGPRRPAVLARPGDGGRVPRAGALRGGRGRRRRQHHHLRPRLTRRRCGAAQAAASAMREVEGAIMPFPGGIARSGSKIGSRYSALPASTNDALCPTLRGQVEHTDVPPDVESVFEIVIDGLALEPVREMMRRGLVAAAQAGASHVTAGNYGGNLGPHHIHLRELVP